MRKDLLQPEKIEVIFTYTGLHKSVCLCGDFNDWSTESHCFKKQGGVWTIRVLLPPGRYRYAFLLDGEKWTPDPKALFQEDDGFGMKNSILIVE
ncbi:MAG: isoamylase early set domain-containing protein [Deltaproteobacteria bacterium]|nr:isoamylase early set domain-containing protein [Deltaproteobacteria bacterium]